MPIVEVKAYSVGQQVFPTIQEAQKSEIMTLFPNQADACGYNADRVASLIVDHTDEIVAILTCTPRAKKVRSDKGTKRKKPMEVAA